MFIYDYIFPQGENTVKKDILKRLLFAAPVLILALTLFFIDFSVRYFKDSVYDFVYDTNVGSIRRFSAELGGLPADCDIVQAYSITVGGKFSVVTFLMCDGNIFSSNPDNGMFITQLMKESDNLTITNEIMPESGYVSLKNGKEQLEFFYHAMPCINKNCYIFMTVRKDLLETEMHCNAVIVPLLIIGILLIISVEYTVYLRIKQLKKE